MIQRGLGTVTVVALLVTVGSAIAAEARTTRTPEWTAAVCRSFSAWERDVARVTSAPLSDDLLKRRAALVRRLRAIDAATARLATALTRAGTPRVARGAALSKALKSLVNQERRALRNAIASAGQLPVSDANSFTAALHDLEASYSAHHNAFSQTLLSVHEIPEIARQLERQPACAALRNA
jgi:hypothetical protein